MGYSQAPEQLQNQESQELKRQNRSLFNTYLSLLKDCSPLKKLPLPICEAQDLERIFVDIVKDRADQVKQLEFDEGFFKEIVDHGKIKKLTDELNSLESISAKNALIDRRETADFIKDVIKEKLELLDLSGNHLSADAWGHVFNEIKGSNIKELRLSLHRVDTNLLEDLCSGSRLCAETLKKLLSHLQKERKERLLASQHRSNGPQNDEVTTLKFIHLPLSQDKILEIQREVIREGMKTSGDQLSLASALESIFSRAILIWLPFDAASSRLTNSEERKRKWESLIPKKNQLNEFFNDAATGGNIVTRLHINVRYLESSESVKQSGTTEDTLFLSVSRIRKFTWKKIFDEIGSRHYTEMVCNDEFKMIFVAGNGPYQWSNFMANENMREFVAGELLSERLPVHFEEKWARDLIGSSNSCGLSIGNGVPNLYFIEAPSKCPTRNIVNLHICLPVQAKELFLTFRVEEIAKFGEVGNILDPKKGILNIDKISYVLFGVRILSHPNTKVAVIFLRKLDSDKSIAIDTDAKPATPAAGSVSDRSDAGRSAVAGSDSDRSAASGSDSDRSAASGSDSDRSAASGSDSDRSAASGSDPRRLAASSSDPGSLAASGSDPRRLAASSSDMATQNKKRRCILVQENRKGSSTIHDAGKKDNETPPGCDGKSARDVPKRRLDDPPPKKAEDVDQTSLSESNNFETGDSDNLDAGSANKSHHEGSDDLSITGSGKPSSADSSTSNTAKPGASNDADSKKAPLNPEEVMEKFKKARSTFPRKKNWLKEDKGHTRRIFLVPTGDLGKNDHTLTSPQPLVENNYLWGSNIINLERVYCRLRPGDILLFSSAKMGFFNRVARVKRIYIVKAEFTNQLWEENKTVMNRKSIKNDGWPVLILVDQPHKIKWNKVDTMADCGYSGSAKLQGPLLPEPKEADKILKQCLQVLGLEEALSFNEKNQPFPIIPDVVERNGKWIVTTMFESDIS